MYEIKTMATINQRPNIKNENHLLGLKSNKKPFPIALSIFIILLILFLLIILIFNIKIYKIHGTSMSPTLKENEYVLSVKKSTYKRGDIIAFYHNNAIMIKRIIGLPGDKIDIKSNGVVIINNQELKEDYIETLAMGNPDIELPYTVPQNKYFVMGDNRSDSLDSRDIAIGCIKETDIIGTVNFSILPFGKLE